MALVVEVAAEMVVLAAIDNISTTKINSSKDKDGSKEAEDLSLGEGPKQRFFKF